MSKYQDSEAHKPLGPHADYNKNLSFAKKFIESIQKHLLPGLEVKISDSEQLANSLLWVSYKPVFSYKMGNYAAPVCLHQNARDFASQVEKVFSAYHAMAQKQILTPQKSNETKKPSQGSDPRDLINF